MAEVAQLPALAIAQVGDSRTREGEDVRAGVDLLLAGLDLHGEGGRERRVGNESGHVVGR